MAVVNSLPPEASVLPKKDRLWYTVTLNRIQIGAFLLLVSAFVATFVNDENVKAHKRIHLIEGMIILVTGAGGGAAVAAAKFKSNEFHEREMQAQIRGISGGFQTPVYATRASDSDQLKSEKERRKRDARRTDLPGPGGF